MMSRKAKRGAVSPLRGCNLWVDTRNEHGESTRSGICEKLEALGGTIHEEIIFSKGVHSTTHVIATMNCSSRLLCETAIAHGVSIVTPAWVEACLLSKQRLDEDEFRISQDDVSRIVECKRKSKSKTPLNAVSSPLSAENKIIVGTTLESSSNSGVSMDYEAKDEKSYGKSKMKPVKSKMKHESVYLSSSGGQKKLRSDASLRSVPLEENLADDGDGDGDDDNDDDDDGDSDDGFPKWFAESVIDSSSKVTSKLRLQERKSDEFLVTEEEIPLPGFEMYYSEHYPNPNTKDAKTGDASAKKQKLLSPSRVNRRSERISDKLPLSQDPGWLQEEDFDALRPDESSEEPYVMPDLAYKENYAGDLDESSSNFSGSQDGSKSNPRNDMKGKESSAKSPYSRFGKDSESFEENRKSTVNINGTAIDEDTVIVMWGPEDIRRVEQSICKAVLAYRAKESTKKMKSVAHQSSQEPSINIDHFAYPMLPDERDVDNYSVLDNTCNQDITPVSLAAVSPSTAPTVLTTNGRRSSVKPSKVEPSHSTSSLRELARHDNIGALMNVAVPSPKRDGKASGRPSPRILGQGSPARDVLHASQRSSEVASALLGLRDDPRAPPLLRQEISDDGDNGNSASGGRDSSSSSKRPSAKLFATSPSNGTTAAGRGQLGERNQSAPLSNGQNSPRVVAPSRLIIPPMDTSEPIVIGTTGFRESKYDDVPDYLHQICKVYGKGVYGERNSARSSSYECDGKRRPRVEVTCVGPDRRGDADHEGNFVTDLLVAPSNGSIRTVRILFALARGVPIVTENWIHDCIERKYFSEWYAFRVERYKHLTLFVPSNMLARTRIFIGGHEKISDEVQRKLYETIGGTIVDDFCNSNLAVFGEPRDYYHWVKSRTMYFQNLAEHKHISERKMEEYISAERSHAANMIERKQLCLFKLIADSLEKGELIHPDDRRDDHLVVSQTLSKVSQSKTLSKTASRSSLYSAKSPSNRKGKSGTVDDIDKPSSNSDNYKVAPSVKAKDEVALVKNGPVALNKRPPMPNAEVENSCATNSRERNVTKKLNKTHRILPLGSNSSTVAFRKDSKKRKIAEEEDPGVAKKQARPRPLPKSRVTAKRRSSRTCSGKPCGNGYTCLKHRSVMVLEYAPPVQPEEVRWRKVSVTNHGDHSADGGVDRDDNGNDDNNSDAETVGFVEEDGCDIYDSGRDGNEDCVQDLSAAKSSPTKIIGGMIEGAVGAMSGFMKSLSQQSRGLGASPVY